jgi:hypothetical protein
MRRIFLTYIVSHSETVIVTHAARVMCSLTSTIPSFHLSE